MIKYWITWSIKQNKKLFENKMYMINRRNKRVAGT